MVFTSILRTLAIVFLTVFLTACASTNATDGGTIVAPGGEIATNFLVEVDQFLDQRIAKPLPDESTTAPLESAAQTSPLLDQQTFIELYERVNPSVVNIQVTLRSSVPEEAGDFTPSFPQIPRFPPYAPELIPPNTPIPQRSQGSGFVYDSEGHIITNNHVVDDAAEITVTFSDGSEAPAQLVGSDPDSDLAVIEVEIDADRLHPVTLGDSDSLKVGQFVIAIGNPFGLEGSMTTGIVSGLGRLLPAAERRGFSIPDIIQTDAAINPGNSGGPLLNLEGEVIGVNTAIQSPSRVFAGIGYAVPAGTVAEVVPELIEHGRIQHPWLGITGGTLTRELAEAMGLDPEQRGVLVAEVVAEGPAFESRLKGSATQITLDSEVVRIGGDLIVGIEDQTVEGIDELISYLLHETEVGQTVTLHILRDGQPMDVEVMLEQRPSDD